MCKRFGGRREPKSHQVTLLSGFHVDFDFVKTRSQLEDFCAKIRSDRLICFDTEFISEYTYQPQLCLIQVATENHLAVIDPLEVPDVDLFWKTLTTGDHLTIVHSGREELIFCLRATEKRPRGLTDLQIAAGLVGLEFPIGYGPLIHRLLGKKLSKGETRTDWSRRPLTDHQIRYALDDVTYLIALWDILRADLESRGRTEWLDEEMQRWQANIESFASSERWRRTSGSSGLSRRSLAILRELWKWRDQRAADRDKPARRILRDDLMVEISKSQTSDPNRIRLIRGMERRDMKTIVDDLACCVATAKKISEDDCPKTKSKKHAPHLNLLGRFLATILSSICKQADVANGLVGTIQDVQDLASHKLGYRSDKDSDVPALSQGWRAGVVGEVIENLLSGKTSVRVQDPRSDHPLVLEKKG